MSTVKQALKKCQVFSTLTEAELEKIAATVTEKQYEAGTNLFQEGDDALEFLVLQQGKVALQMTVPKAQGQVTKRITVDVVSNPDIVGWSAIVEPYIYTFTAVCLQKVNVLSINGSKFRKVLQDDYKISCEILQALIKVVASRLEDTRRVLLSERLLLLEPQQS